MSRYTNLRFWSSLTAVTCLALGACRSPADPSNVDLVPGDAGAPAPQKPEVDPGGDKPVGPIAGDLQLSSPSAGGNSGSPKPGAPPPRDVVGGAGGMGPGGMGGKAPIGNQTARAEPVISPSVN